MGLLSRLLQIFEPDPPQPKKRQEEVKVVQYVRAGAKVKSHKRRVTKIQPEKPTPVAKPKRKPKSRRMDPALKEWSRAFDFRVWLAQQDGKPFSGKRTYIRREYGTTIGRCTWNGHGALANTICAEEQPYGFLGDKNRTSRWVYWFYCTACADDWESNQKWAGYTPKK